MHKNSSVRGTHSLTSVKKLFNGKNEDWQREMTENTYQG